MKKTAVSEVCSRFFSVTVIKTCVTRPVIIPSRVNYTSVTNPACVIQAAKDTQDQLLTSLFQVTLLLFVVSVPSQQCGKQVNAALHNDTS